MTSLIAHIELHPALDTASMHELITSSRDVWTPRQLHDLTARATHHLASPLLDLVQYTPQQRWWTRLALTDGVELWLLSWLPGQHTAPHDHGGAAGSFTVLTGTLTEDYRYPGGPIRTASHPTHASIAFGAGRAHQITNPHITPAASVHAYSPPQIPTRHYTTLLDIPNQIPALTIGQSETP
jgi:hypothetical protein